VRDDTMRRYMKTCLDCCFVRFFSI